MFNSHINIRNAFVHDRCNYDRVLSFSIFIGGGVTLTVCLMETRI